MAESERIKNAFVNVNTLAKNSIEYGKARDDQDMAKKNKDGYVLKSEVNLIIQNYIRVIQMNDYGNDNGIPQLYRVMDMIEKMPIKDSF